MNRDEIQRAFPDTYGFFADVSDEHPFWQSMARIDHDAVQEDHTLLPDLEQVFSSLHQVDGHALVKQTLEQVITHHELMRLLTKLYVAYLYRNHGVRLVQEKHGYDIELEIADQLLALGIVDFHNFDSPELQFAAQIESELAYLAEMKKRNESQESNEASAAPDIDEKQTDMLLNALKEHASNYTDHPDAHHQVLAVVTHHSVLPRQIALAQRIEEAADEMREHFPHLAGVLLIDPEPGEENATFIPFHGHDASDLEQLLNRVG